jgi:hypothetical protein
MAQWNTSHRKLLASDTTQPLSHVHIPLCLSLNGLSLFLCHCMIFPFMGKKLFTFALKKKCWREATVPHVHRFSLHCS